MKIKILLVCIFFNLIVTSPAQTPDKIIVNEGGWPR